MFVNASFACQSGVQSLRSASNFKQLCLPKSCLASQMSRFFCQTARFKIAPRASGQPRAAWRTGQPFMRLPPFQSCFSIHPRRRVHLGSLTREPMSCLSSRAHGTPRCFSLLIGLERAGDKGLSIRRSLLHVGQSLCGCHQEQQAGQPKPEAHRSAPGARDLLGQH